MKIAILLICQLIAAIALIVIGVSQNNPIQIFIGVMLVVFDFLSWYENNRKS